jgi:hypothetical protein
MNRRTTATALLAVVVLLAVALLAPVAMGAAKKTPPVTPPVIEPPTVAVDDAPSPVAPNGPTFFPSPGPVEPVLPDIHDTMRHLWIDHIVWSRNVTMAVFSDLKGLDTYEQRLVTNTYDMRDLLTPYFGKEAASTFADLYLQHVTLASTVFEAYKSGNETWIRDVTYEWYLNADDIAAFLYKLNPSWNYDQMRSLWRTHLDTVVDEALDYKDLDYTGDVMCYDAAQDHVFVLADYMSAGILMNVPKSK